ncbi:MAG: T9SS type A sorting domain-containing protein [Candidatus Latescibacter sp.]|nr:T9SS type A sorting domain-containing protein [Candidatus Latescibacter sp.]
MITRRRFIKTLAAAGTTALANPIYALNSRTQASTGYFGVHQFIESHPEAVFIMRTTVGEKMNADAKKSAGLVFGRSVFVPKDNTGVPINISIPVKPNLKTADPKVYPIADIIGHVADPFFVEGMFEGMKELGISGSQFHIREVNRPEAWGPYFYVDMAKRVGADLRLDLAPTVNNLVSGRDYNWKDIPNGTFWKRIPYLEPVNTPNTWMLNISKFKAHTMGLTLCCKCLQGTAAHNYQQFCAAWNSTMSITQSDRQPDAYTVIKANYDRHVAMGIPRWDRPGQNNISGLGQETWVTRTLDSLSVTLPSIGLHVIEGIYGRDGQGDGVNGPNPQDQVHQISESGVTATGKAWDYMSNIIIFGKDPFRVDNIGYYLGGHEPGNFGLFHIAIERKMSTALDPREIPVYIWDNGAATLTPLEKIPRTPLLSYYLTRNYNGQTEKIFHLVNEPVDYSKFEKSVGVEESYPETPKSFVLRQNHPNPFNPFTAIEYDLPRSGYARLEVYNSNGQLMDVLVDGYQARGAHMAVWNSQNRASGTYFYRFRFGDFTETKKMTLLR